MIQNQILSIIEDTTENVFKIHLIEIFKFNRDLKFQ
jgi:hypothetical protein